MEFDNSFEVPVPVEEGWALLMDVERIAPCVPGAELTERVDEQSFKGKIAVKLGPVALTFNGQARFEEIDEAGHSASLSARGNDTKGRGGAQAKVRFSMEPCEAGSRVLIHTDLTMSGAVAQYGRGAGMVKDLAQAIIGQFASNLEKNVIAPGRQQAAAPAETAPAEPTPESSAAPPPSEAAPAAPKPEAPPRQPAAPVQMGGLGLKVLWNAIVRWFRGLFGG